MAQPRRKRDVLVIMRRVGLGDRVEEAQRLLPESIDLDRPEDRELLYRVGLPLDVDELRDRMGGTP